MAYKKLITKPVAPTLTNDEILEQSNYLQDNGFIAREAIASYVEGNIPIPNELKTILYNILNIDYKGKKPDQTQASNLNLVKEIIFLIQEDNEKVCDAISKVAQKYNRQIESVKRIYEDAKYKKLKTIILTAK